MHKFAFFENQKRQMNRIELVLGSFYCKMINLNCLKKKFNINFFRYVRICLKIEKFLYLVKISKN